MSDPAAGLSALVLGAAAGGGFPQWNCGCRLCRLVRAGDPRLRPSTQASVAVSGDNENWIVVGASPDLRQQILQTPQLWPRSGARHSPIVGVVLLGGDVDALAGLLTLRERQPFTVYGARDVLDLLRTNRIFGVLDPAVVRLEEIVTDEPVDCGAGLQLRLLEMPGKVPLYLESAGATRPEPGPTHAACLEANGRRVIVAPACADITDGVRRQLGDADVVFFDGTLFTDDEMIVAGLGEKTGRRMGHVPVSGPRGTLEGLGDLRGRHILLHINNSNPILLADSPERLQVEAAGFEVAYDGMEIRL
jgi:pyrroloquinoline quinone biosynthesis protein B